MAETESVNAGIAEEIKMLEMRAAELKDVAGENKDEVSLLTQLCGKCFQGIPEYQTV